MTRFYDLIKELDYMSPGLLDRMRELRLWHWRRCLKYRKQELRMDKPEQSALRHKHKKKADDAIRFVQYLNGFFPYGDGVQKDSDK